MKLLARRSLLAAAVLISDGPITLIDAAENDDVDRVKALIAAHANVNDGY